MNLPPPKKMWSQTLIWERNIVINKNIGMYWSSKSSCKTFHTYSDKIMMIFTWLFISAMTSTYPYFLPYCYKDLFTDTEDGIFKWWLCIHSVTLPRKWKKNALNYTKISEQSYGIYQTKLWVEHTVYGQVSISLLSIFSLFVSLFCGCFMLNSNGA